MIFSKLYVIPIALFILILGSIIITYIISVVLDHARPIFPYISDTGTTPPESTIFTQALNMGAVLIYITFYVRCKEVKTLYNDPTLPHYSRVVLLNRISLWISLPIAIGATVTANFQQSNAFVPHMIGAFLCFAVGMLYFWLHTGISYLTSPTLCTMTMLKIRVVLVIIGSMACLFTGTFGVISFLRFRKSIADMPKWGPEDGGYDLHLVSTSSEWLTLLFYGFYVLTFVKEFKDLALQSPKLKKLSCTTSQTLDYGTTAVTISSLDNMDRTSGDNTNGTAGVAPDLGKEGSKTVLV